MAGIIIFGTLSNIQMMFFTWRKGVLAGVDEFGNKYFKGKPRKGTKRERRWVVYKEDFQASNVPPEWHGWLHHQSDIVPGKTKKNPHRHDWVKPHKPNMSGTDEAYFPPGYDGKREDATGNYVAWKPSKKAAKK